MPNGERAYTLGEMFETLTDAIWSELGTGGRARNVDSFRRNLQRTYVEHFAQMRCATCPISSTVDCSSGGIAEAG